MKKAENIRLVVARNGLQHPVYVGDTKGDEEAAHAAGVPFVHAAYGFGRAVQPEAVIEKIAPKIVEGRLNSFYKETVLLEQAYVKDPSKTVGDLFKEVGGTATAFARVEVGKGAEA